MIHFDKHSKCVFTCHSGSDSISSYVFTVLVFAVASDFILQFRREDDSEFMRGFGG